jgi:hypothetical protein
MATHRQTQQLFALSDGMNKFNELMDKSLKMAIHMDIVVDKLIKMVGRIFQVVASIDAALQVPLSYKMGQLSHPDLIKLRDSLAALDLPNDRNLTKSTMHSIKSTTICCSTTRSTMLLR